MKAEEILKSGLKLLESKGQDYCEDREVNQFENFERSNLIASWFKHDEDKSFAVLIGTKLARLASLLNSSRTPNNESTLDSFIDGANYFALWGGKRITSKDTEVQIGQTVFTEVDRDTKLACDAIDAVAKLSDRDLLDITSYAQELYKGRMMMNSVKPRQD